MWTGYSMVTKFFHTTTIIRRRKKKICVLMDDDGQWQEVGFSLVTWSETIFIISIRRKTQTETKETCSMAFLLLQKEGSRPYLAQSVLLK